MVYPERCSKYLFDAPVAPGSLTMANQFNLNVSSPATFGELMFNLKEHLVNQASWTVESSSDGTSYNASGDEWTVAADAANTRSWTRLRSPVGAGGREFTMQRTTSDLQWRIKYSRTAGFVGGSPDATTTPSATDEGIAQGGGTDASPTFVNMFQGTAVNQIAQYMCDDASPYNWYMITYNTGIVPGTIMGMDEAASGTAVGDADPNMFWCRSLLNVMANATVSASTITSCPAQAWTGPGTGGEKYQNQRGLEYSDSSSGTAVPLNFGTNPNNGEDQLVPIMFGRDTLDGIPSGLKQFSTLANWPAQPRSNLDRYNITGAASHIQFGDLVVIWDGSTVATI